MSASHSPVALVAGDTSFIGGRLCEELTAKKLQVICVDKQDTDKLLEQSFPRLDYIVDISQGEKSLLELAKKTGAKYLLASTDYSSSGALVDGYKQDVDIRTVCLGDVYGPGMDLSANTPLARLLKSCVYNEPARIDETWVYPIFVDDVVWGIIKSLFSPGTRGAVISLSRPPARLSEVAEVLKSLGANMADENVQENSLIEGPVERRVPPKGRELIAWEPHTTIIEGLATTFSWLKSHRHTNTPIQAKLKEDRAESGIFEEKRSVFVKRGRRTPLFFSALIVFAVLFWLFAFPFIESLFGLANLKIASTKHNKDNLSDASAAWADIANFWFVRAESGFLRWESVPGLKGSASNLARENRVLSRVAEILNQQIEVEKSANKLFNGILGEDAFPLVKYTQALQLESLSLYQTLGFLETEVQADKTLTSLLDRTLHKSSQDISDTKRGLRGVAKVLSSLDDLLGQQAKKTYLVLIEDNTQIRPSGGVIIGYGLLTFDKGRLISSEFFPTETADSQLSGHVDPPEPLKKYASQNSWFLKDSSWSPDFPTTASRAAWFIDKELDQNTDGVIGLDLSYLRDLVGVVGTLDVENTNNRLTQDNFYKTITRALDRKGELSVAITKALVSKFSEKAEVIENVLFMVTLQNLDAKHLVISTNNKEARTVLVETGWSGGVGDALCQEEPCLLDSVYFSEANLGTANGLFIERSYSLDVFFQENVILHKLTVFYKSRSQSEYRNYFKVLLPQKAQNIKAVSIDSTSTQSDIALDLGNEARKRSAGGFVTVPAGKTEQIVLSWETPKLDIASEYALLWQKQPGTENDSFWLTINNPGYWPKETTPTPSLTSLGSVGYNDKLSRDFLVNIKWQKQ